MCHLRWLCLLSWRKGAPIPFTLKRMWHHRWLCLLSWRNGAPIPEARTNCLLRHDVEINFLSSHSGFRGYSRVVSINLRQGQFAQTKTVKINAWSNIWYISNSVHRSETQTLWKINVPGQLVGTSVALSADMLRQNENTASCMTHTALLSASCIAVCMHTYRFTYMYIHTNIVNLPESCIIHDKPSLCLYHPPWSMDRCWKCFTCMVERPFGGYRCFCTSVCATTCPNSQPNNLSVHDVTNAPEWKRSILCMHHPRWYMDRYWVCFTCIIGKAMWRLPLLLHVCLCHHLPNFTC